MYQEFLGKSPLTQNWYQMSIIHLIPTLEIRSSAKKCTFMLASSCYILLTLASTYVTTQRRYLRTTLINFNLLWDCIDCMGITKIDSPWLTCSKIYECKYIRETFKVCRVLLYKLWKPCKYLTSAWTMHSFQSREQEKTLQIFQSTSQLPSFRFTTEDWEEGISEHFHLFLAIC